MGNDLRQRLEALHAEANMAIEAGISDESIALRQLMREFLDAAFRAGDLVTRQEMEEAVAKAVAEEREACAELAEEHCDWHPVNIPVAHHIRARSEQKEGE